MGDSYNTSTGNTYSTATIRKIELQNTHEQVQLKEEHDHEEKMAKLRYENEQTIKDKECQHEVNINNQSLGWFGRLFGSQENSSRNITAAICILLTAGVSIISCIVYFCNLSFSEQSIASLLFVLKYTIKTFQSTISNSTFGHKVANRTVCAMFQTK